MPSLDVPHADAAIEHMRDSAAVQLLVDRARLLRPAFAITPGSAEAIGEICRRLDGIPLAIELAAAQLRAMSPVELATALDERFRLLRGGSRTALARQQTLQASVDWSHERLSTEQQTVFRRLAAFAAPFDLAAAAAVAGFDEVHRDDVADVLTSWTAHKSL